MGKSTGFLEISRQKPARRPVAERVRDWHEFEGVFPDAQLRGQASRCMDCGVPFCHQGCPVGNNIPDWNDLIYRDRWEEASSRLHATNNFPEFTGRVCPAPCEESCVLNLEGAPVSIKHIEDQIVERAWNSGWITPQFSSQRTGKKVAIVGSGPAGLACAQQLARKGRNVTIFERADRVGGLLRYGIPDFKLEKWRIDRRVEQMTSEGVVFRTSVEIGVDVSLEQLRAEFDAVLLAVGARQPRDLPIEGRTARGIHYAMDYLEQANRMVAGDLKTPAISAENKHVVILGGGDTGADCLGTAHRQGARSVHQLELLPRPPEGKNPATPWPAWPTIFRTSAAHDEGGTRDFGILTKRIITNDRDQLEALECVRVEWRDGKPVEQTDSLHSIKADMVLLALGFSGAEPSSMYERSMIRFTERGILHADETLMTHAPGIFTCGDARRGQSLIVWAIREGRDAAASIHHWLRTP